MKTYGRRRTLRPPDPPTPASLSKSERLQTLTYTIKQSPTTCIMTWVWKSTWKLVLHPWRGKTVHLVQFLVMVKVKKKTNKWKETWFFLRWKREDHPPLWQPYGRRRSSVSTMLKYCRKPHPVWGRDKWPWSRHMIKCQQLVKVALLAEIYGSFYSL